jgi:hypothetical protein
MPHKKKIESNTCTIKNLSDNENMPSFLWQGNLLNRTSKIKRLLARHDIQVTPLYKWVGLDKNVNMTCCVAT